MSNYREEISFKLLDNVGLIGITPSGWQKELNLVSWNGYQPKYDIRDWSPEHDRMSKGLTLTEDELKGLHNLLIDKYGAEKVIIDEKGESKDE